MYACIDNEVYAYWQGMTVFCARTVAVCTYSKALRSFICKMYMACLYRKLHYAHHSFWHKGCKIKVIQKEIWANVSTQQSWWHVQELTVCTAELTEVAPTWGVWVALSILCTFPLWTDDEYVTGYGVQVLGWYDGDDFDCTGSTQDLRATGSVDFSNKVRLVSCHFPYMAMPRLLCWVHCSKPKF